MSNNSNDQNITQRSVDIMDIIKQQQQMDKVQALLKLLEIKETDINVAGDLQKVLNIELITEYPNATFTKTMIKNETWRNSVKQVLHLGDVNEEKIVGAMDVYTMLKMTSHKRKRVHEIINGLKNDTATTEIIPQNTKKKKFLGLV